MQAWTEAYQPRGLEAAHPQKINPKPCSRVTIPPIRKTWVLIFAIIVGVGFLADRVKAEIEKKDEEIELANKIKTEKTEQWQT